MIYIFPLAGLANRMRVIASALSLSNDLKQKVLIVWKKDNGLNADFEILFKKNPQLLVKKHNVFYQLFFYVGQNPILNKFREILHLTFKVDLFITEKEIPELVWKNNDNLIIEDKKIKNIALITCHQFKSIDLTLSQLLPVDFIYFKAKNLVLNKKNVIGLHIRRKDHQESIIHSPLCVFEEKIIFEIINDPEVNFYLSTDDIETINYLTGKYKKRIIYFDKKFDRSCPINIVDAYVDFCALSMCNKIYGSYFSSFSFVASKINNIELDILYI